MGNGTRARNRPKSALVPRNRGTRDHVSDHTKPRPNHHWDASPKTAFLTSRTTSSGRVTRFPQIANLNPSRGTRNLSRVTRDLSRVTRDPIKVTRNPITVMRNPRRVTPSPPLRTPSTSHCSPEQSGTPSKTLGNTGISCARHCARASTVTQPGHRDAQPEQSDARYVHGKRIEPRPQRVGAQCMQTSCGI
ncbi:hypothetical protein F7D09_1677 [Bifidobacterium leontopitheci]|uniref:Uncharacterized protein n=1 Tax=Bifidobacterium leontopitheci TaxID=2650774 RepID=A0A6I1GDW7_9BIFI|nr:hypothetical protein F7D09_1677 [Bifidobacterium leontopitheci]